MASTGAPAGGAGAQPGAAAAAAVHSFEEVEGVKGTLCADSRGLCVQAKGVADANVAGFFTSVIRRANTLAHSDSDALTVLIETEKLNIIVKEYDDLTLAVYQAAGKR